MTRQTSTEKTRRGALLPLTYNITCGPEVGKAQFWLQCINLLAVVRGCHWARSRQRPAYRLEIQ